MRGSEGTVAEPEPPRLRLAWVEEWMSSVAAHVLPELARRHDIYYVTAGDEVPEADFRGVLRAKRWRHMNLAGFELSRRVNTLYREGLIDMAVVWASIGFALRGVPFVNLEGGSVYAQIQLFASAVPFHKRAAFLTGFVHYAVPEILCNRRAAAVVVPSRALKNDLMRLHGVPEGRVVVVPHGVEPEHLALYERRTPGPPRILFVGRLHCGKGIVPVVEEFVRRRDIEADFLIAGDGPERRTLEAAAAGDGRVKLLGSIGREEVDAALLATDVFVFPTLYEGFGLALSEAMASGHACVAYDIPAIRELLGDAGITVPAGDAVALVDQVARLVAAPDGRAAHAARAHARAERLSWQAAQAAIERVIRDTSAPRKKGFCAVCPASS
jgi:glycosyltransferase involved in cell wall biosynthesis